MMVLHSQQQARPCACSQVRPTTTMGVTLRIGRERPERTTRQRRLLVSGAVMIAAGVLASRSL